ncbi:MAG: hypothetical protein ETSY1_43920 [Candidatus Entotheonella factor]|uniref:Uncharacterized protein n=1 Tax=Entotheonella factor TaxID=1429438 RepID=W4L3Y7_ENTF1|nr:MAG: hypothetical protein ETSY1_43920 [Candidatus Entotheonella factor]
MLDSIHLRLSLTVASLVTIASYLPYHNHDINDAGSDGELSLLSLIYLLQAKMFTLRRSLEMLPESPLCEPNLEVSRQKLQIDLKRDSACVCPEE